MAAAAHRLGYRYIAITDHSKALAMANGLDEARALQHAERVRALNGRFEGMTLLAGIECDILPDGQLDLADDCLAQLDIVVASIHSHFSQDEAQMTDRVLRALECRWVDVLGHPTGRRLLKRDPLRLTIDAVLNAVARYGVYLALAGRGFPVATAVVNVSGAFALGLVVVGVLMRRMTKRYLEMEAQGLKAQTEQQRQDAPPA